MGGTWTPQTPDWVVPSVSQIADEHWLAYAMLRNQRDAWAAGVGTAISWVRSGRDAPITNRPERPVTRVLAQAESWAAEAASDPTAGLPLDLIYRQLDVTPYPPKPGRNVKYTLGVWRALRWLLGVPDQAAPIPVPRRHPDGRLYTADDLYAEVIRTGDGRLSPEQRATKRIQAERDAAEYLHYDEQMTAVQEALRAR
ncbi:MAG: hypothetical protein M3460_10900 [Actinomycetota bacterium]|nr:hypothetical protein [Actinomycetota bacterium]